MQQGLWRQRLLILFAIACGSLAAGLFYRSHRLPTALLSDDQAKNFGYASAADEHETTADFNKYWPDILAHGRLSDDEYQLAARSMVSGSKASKMRIIIVLGYVRGNSERKRALALMPRDQIEPALYGLWRSSFFRWMKGPKDESVLSLLSSSGNPNAVKLSDELRRSGNA